MSGAVDFTPSWKTGKTTLRELEAPLSSLRTVFAAADAAMNARLWLHGVDLVDGQLWRAQVWNPDPKRAEAFLWHWKRLAGNDCVLVVQDIVTDRWLSTHPLSFPDIQNGALHQSASSQRTPLTT